MNRWQIEQAKELAKMQKRVKEEARNILPSIYACLAKVLYEKHGIDADTIAEIFEETQEAWTEAVDQEGDMIKWCEELTGIELRSELLS